MYNRDKDPMLQVGPNGDDFWERKKHEANQEKYINELLAENQQLREHLAACQTELAVERDQVDSLEEHIKELNECHD